MCGLQGSFRVAGNHALGQRGFLLMDTLLDFVFDFYRSSKRSILEKNEQLKIRRAKPADFSAHGDK